MSRQIQYINEATVRRLLTWPRLIPAVQRALAAYSRGPSHPKGAVQPLRSAVEVKEHAGTVLVMPGLVKETEALATKIVSLYPNNVSMGVSTHHALVLLLHAHTGQPAAILEGEAITEMRTAAASAVATQSLLANRTDSGKDVVVAVLGAGTQARSHARVMHHIFKQCQIKIWSRREDSARELAATLREEGVRAEVCGSVREAVQDADVINTCTLATTPIVRAAWVKPGAHINSVGAPRPDWQELDEELVRESIIYADSKEAAMAEAGDIIKAGAAVEGEIGELLDGLKTPPRDKTTIFKSLGLAVEDAVAARVVYDALMDEEAASTT